MEVTTMSGRSNGRTRSTDGVEIAYSCTGAGPTSLLFIHGGLADRTFWEPQLAALGDRFRLAALDLAGHGESGRDRRNWTIPAFGEDARAVADALDLQNIALVGNSLGGAVALEAARMLAGRAVGVIGVDTLHEAGFVYSAEDANARGAEFRNSFEATCAGMIRGLFHAGRHLELQDWALKITLRMDPEVVARIMEGFAGYDLAAAFRRAGVPIRAINGDLYPTSVESNRAVVPDFDAVIMPGAGHYPMLERPDEFNRLLVATVDSLAKR
jgi:pimeloyl-ACP methyl ester carboxylesterase